MNRPGAGSASQPRATRRFAFERSDSTRAGTTYMPNAAAIGNALRAALGVRVRSLPLTPEAITRAIQGEADS